ncbi:MAG: class I SAM-dependent methyltransferase, partial [Candidatus Aminicenantes bacterium]|nr:class I SAM-dependent methyltransferase [Candidatus Aminicenantes bacterium]
MLKKKSKKKYFIKRYGNDLFFRRNIYDVTVKNIEKGSHVLDLGCASGHIGAYLKDHLSCKVLAVDMDEENVELSKKRGV